MNWNYLYFLQIPIFWILYFILYYRWKVYKHLLPDNEAMRSFIRAYYHPALQYDKAYEADFIMLVHAVVFTAFSLLFYFQKTREFSFLFFCALLIYFIPWNIDAYKAKIQSIQPRTLQMKRLFSNEDSMFNHEVFDYFDSYSDDFGTYARVDPAYLSLDKIFRAILPKYIFGDACMLIHIVFSLVFWLKK